MSRCHEFLALVLTVLFTFQKGGEAPLSYGLTWVVAFVFSAVGLFFSVKGRMRPDTYVFFPTIEEIIGGHIRLTGEKQK